MYFLYSLVLGETKLGFSLTKDNVFFFFYIYLSIYLYVCLCTYISAHVLTCVHTHRCVGIGGQFAAESLLLPGVLGTDLRSSATPLAAEPPSLAHTSAPLYAN